jgi:hypothetical protein
MKIVITIGIVFFAVLISHAQDFLLPTCTLKCDSSIELLPGEYIGIMVDTVEHQTKILDSMMQQLRVYKNLHWMKKDIYDSITRIQEFRLYVFDSIAHRDALTKKISPELIQIAEERREREALLLRVGLELSLVRDSIETLDWAYKAQAYTTMCSLRQCLSGNMSLLSGLCSDGRIFIDGRYIYSMRHYQRSFQSW